MSPCSSYVVMWYVSTMNKKDWYNYTVAVSSHHKYVCMASYSPLIPGVVVP